MDNKIPKYTDLGFEKFKVPNDLYCLIMDEYKSITDWQFNRKVEYSKEQRVNVVSGISILNSNSPYYRYYPLSDTLVDKCYSVLTPIVSEWANIDLERTHQYGIRSYCKNSILHMHTDVQDTHVISCILFIAEHPTDTKWPLDYIDHNNKHHQIVFNPGEMLFYESLRPHGRVTPFSGNYYRNFYVHWKPVNWDHPYTGKGIIEYKSVEESIKISNYDFK